MNKWFFFGGIVAVQFDEGCCVLVGNRPWPTKKDHFVYCYYEKA